jgi:hypothetical protein
MLELWNTAVLDDDKTRFEGYLTDSTFSLRIISSVVTENRWNNQTDVSFAAQSGNNRSVNDLISSRQKQLESKLDMGLKQRALPTMLSTHTGRYESWAAECEVQESLVRGSSNKADWRDFAA